MLKVRAGWRDQGPIVEVNNQQQNVHVAMDPAVLAHKGGLLRDAILMLKGLGVSAVQDFEEPDFKALPGRGAARANSGFNTSS